MTSTKALIALAPTILSWLIVLWGVLASKASTAQTLPLLPTKLTLPARYAPFYRSTANLVVPDSVRLPKGFRASVFHAGMMKPRFFAWSPSGVLHVVDMSAETVFALPDRNGDGIADTSYIAASSVKEAHNVVFYQGAMLLALFTTFHTSHRTCQASNIRIFLRQFPLIPVLTRFRRAGWIMLRHLRERCSSK